MSACLPACLPACLLVSNSLSREYDEPKRLGTQLARSPNRVSRNPHSQYARYTHTHTHTSTHSCTPLSVCADNSKRAVPGQAGLHAAAGSGGCIAAQVSGYPSAAAATAAAAAATEAHATHACKPIRSDPARGKPGADVHFRKRKEMTIGSACREA